MIRSESISPNAVPIPLVAKTVGLVFGMPFPCTSLCVFTAQQRVGGSCAQVVQLLWHLMAFLEPNAVHTLNTLAMALACAVMFLCATLASNQVTGLSPMVCLSVIV